MKLNNNLVLVIVILLFGYSTILFAQQQSKDSVSYVKLIALLKQKKYKACLHQALQFKEQYVRRSNDKMYYRTLRVIGHCHKNTGNYERALDYYLQARKGFVEEKDSTYMIVLGNNLARVYSFLQKNDKAIFHIQESLQYNHQLKDTMSALSAYGNMVGQYVRQKKYNLAQDYANKALALFEKSKNKKPLVSLYNNLGGIYYLQKDYQKAKEIYLKGYALIDEDTKLTSKMSIIQNLASTYILLGNKEKAKDFIGEALILSDETIKEKYNSQITKIEAQYNTNKEQQKTKIERQKKRQLQLWLLAVTLLLLGVSSIIWFYYRDNKTKKEKLALRLINQQLEQYQKIKKLQVQNQSKVLNAVAAGKETERIAIAQVLHDSVGALLSSANMHLQVVKKKNNQDIVEVQKAQEIITETANKVRNLSHQLISEVLLKFGLVVAIDSLCAKYSNDDIVFELIVENEIPRFEQAFEIKMNSIIEELLNNCIKHSHATEVVISLFHENEMLTVVVQDNGVGLNLGKVNEFESVGLAQIKARVESNNGVFIITSIKNKFSKFYIKIPVECN